MSRFYLHLWNGIGFVRDEEGQELTDLDHARASAMTTVRSLLSEEAKEGVIDLRGRIEISDASGQVLATVTFCDAVAVHVGQQP